MQIQTTLAPGAPWPYSPALVAAFHPPKPVATLAERLKELLQGGSYTRREVALSLNVSDHIADGHLRRLYRQGHAIRFDSPEKAPSAKYHFCYTWATNKQPAQKKKTFSEATASKLIPYLVYGTMNCSDLAAASGLHFSTVLTYTRELHRKKRVYICGYEKNSGGHYSIKLYKLGQGKDVVIKKVHRSVRDKAYKAKIAERKAQEGVAA